MSLRVVGAGLGRTGTNSLKLALEQLLGGPCYHMLEVFGRPGDIPAWHQAVHGELPDWQSLFGDYVAAVDWPVAAFWRELAAAYPDALVLLSVRADADEWWASASSTIFKIVNSDAPPDEEVLAAQMAMAKDLLSKRFCERWYDPDEAKAAYEAHNAAVRATVAPGRLVEWTAGDGWGPVCDALGLAVPDAPFPHVNTSEEFRDLMGLDSSPDP